jgi:hypothetical protein
MTQCKIIAAPSKFDLSVAFFDGKYPNRRSVKFTIKIPNIHKEYEVNVVINQLAWEDGSGDSWCFEGHISSSTCGYSPDFKRGVSAKGWFKTTTRNGSITIN